MAVGGCRSAVAERWQLKPEALGSIPGGTTFLSFPLPFQRSTDSNGPKCLWLDNHYRSSDCGRVLSIGFPMLWLRSPSVMINNCTQQSSNTLLEMTKWHKFSSLVTTNWNQVVLLPWDCNAVMWTNDASLCNASWGRFYTLGRLVSCVHAWMYECTTIILTVSIPVSMLCTCWTHTWGGQIHVCTSTYYVLVQTYTTSA